VAQRANYRADEIDGVPGIDKIVPDSLCRLRMDGERVFPGTLVDDAERVEAAVLVQVADSELRDLGPA
jgi:hypothetical protein